MGGADPGSPEDDGVRTVVQRLADRAIVVTPKQADELAVAARRLQQMKDLLRDAAQPDDSVRHLQGST